MRLIKREGERAGNAPVAISPTGAAQPQTMHAHPASTTSANAEQKAPQSPQNCAKPALLDRTGDPRGAGNAPRSETSADRRQDRSQTKQTIDGIDAEMYHKLVNEVGAPARRKKKVDVDLADKMHRAGWSYAQIAKHFKVSPCTVRRRLERARRHS